jgi:toxin ParE1/3/4
MPRLSLTSAARDDIVSIQRYITEQSGSAVMGRQFARTLREKCTHLASLPGMLGRARPDLRPGLRSFAFKGYVIFFRYVGDVFEVVDVLEGHRDIDAYFDDRSV